MTEGFSFKLVSKRLQYEFTVDRKIMRITGDSATGKTELVRLIEDASDPNTGIAIDCKHECRVVSSSYFNPIARDIVLMDIMIENHESKEYTDTMREILMPYDNILFFVDESFDSIGTDEFALFCQYTDSSFVLICRDPLRKLPYSQADVYEIRTSGKSHTLEKKPSTRAMNAFDFEERSEYDAKS